MRARTLEHALPGEIASLRDDLGGLRALFFEPIECCFAKFLAHTLPSRRFGHGDQPDSSHIAVFVQLTGDVTHENAVSLRDEDGRGAAVQARQHPAPVELAAALAVEVWIVEETRRVVADARQVCQRLTISWLGGPDIGSCLSSPVVQVGSEGDADVCEEETTALGRERRR